METKRNADNNENTNLELVLEQFTNEQKSQTKSLSELVLAVNSLSKNVTNFKEEINNITPISVSTDTLPIQELIRKAVTNIKLIVEAQQQKPVIKKYQLLLFPEQDAKLFYKVVFGRWFLWLTVMLFLTNFYKFSIKLSDDQKILKLELLENDRIKQAWFRLYSLPNKSLRRLMDTTYFKTVRIDH